jgi:hypothetical protein
MRTEDGWQNKGYNVEIDKSFNIRQYTKQRYEQELKYNNGTTTLSDSQSLMDN